jgi:hypothetical protein
MRRVLVVVLMLLASVLSVSGVAAPASASSNPDNCRADVNYFYKSAGRVYVHARVICDRTQDKISVKAFLRRGDTWSRPDAVTCTKVTWCVGVASLADKSGSQLYSGGAVQGWYPPSTYARRGSTTMTCGNGMPCKLAGKYC